MSTELTDFKRLAEDIDGKQVSSIKFKDGKFVLPVLGENEIKVAKEVIHKNHKLYQMPLSIMFPWLCCCTRVCSRSDNEYRKLRN